MRHIEKARMKNLKFIVIGACIFIIVIGILLWYKQHNKPSAQKSKLLTTVTVALDWTPNTNHTGMYAALAKGWYKDQGLNVKILPYSSTTSPDVHVTSGKADVGISA